MAPVDVCAILINPTESPDDALRLTGTYCPPPPPSAGSVELRLRPTRFCPRLEKMQPLPTSPPPGERGGGDSNPATLENDYRRWLAGGEDQGPGARTHSRGRALDEIILKPGSQIPP